MPVQLTVTYTAAGCSVQPWTSAIRRAAVGLKLTGWPCRITGRIGVTHGCFGCGRAVAEVPHTT